MLAPDCGLGMLTSESVAKKLATLKAARDVLRSKYKKSKL